MGLLPLSVLYKSFASTKGSKLWIQLEDMGDRKLSFMKLFYGIWLVEIAKEINRS